MAPSLAQSGASTRVTTPETHARKSERSYPYRALADYVLGELDLRDGDVVADIGAGDGWWSERFGKAVGAAGLVHAAEVDGKLVEKMREKLSGLPQVRPYLCKKESPELPERSCDLVFFSQSYHHLEAAGRVEYLKRVKTMVKLTGRLVVIEEYPLLPATRAGHGTTVSTLVKEAEEAGWVLVRCELMVGTYHYLAIFVQKDLFPPREKPVKRARL
jgi:ubiquinone/menaquinone biosynthesis C-methylase UbiE